MEIGTIFLLSLLLLPLLLFLKKKQNKNLPPSPPTLPFIGNLHQLGSLPHQSLWKLARKHGPVMLLQLGSVKTVVVSSAETAKTVLKTHDLDCCSRPPLDGARMMTYNYIDLAFSPYGEYWREIRKICVLELFSVKRVESYQSIRVEEVAKLINSIADHSSSSSASPINLTDKLFSLTASILFKIAFGVSFQGSDLHHNRFHEVLLEAGAAFGSFCAAEFFPYVGWIVDRLSGLQQRREKVFRELDSFYQGIIEAHLRPDRREQEHEDIIDVLLKIMKGQSQFRAGFLTEKNIKAVLFVSFKFFSTIFFAQ